MSNPQTTPTSKRSPSILVTDVRQNPPGRSAPFVNRLKNISVDSLLSSTSQVPSAVRRITPNLVRARRDDTPRSGAKAPPRLTTPMPSRCSKNSQRLVLIPAEDEPGEGSEVQAGITQAEQLPRDERAAQFPRCTSYCIADGFNLKNVSEFVRKKHKARTRIYDEALFIDYLLPLLPGDDVESRIQSSLGDNRTIERMIDASEQGDHHFEYFSSEDTQQANNGEEFDPSEPQEFSPREAPVLDQQRRDSQDVTPEGADQKPKDGKTRFQKIDYHIRRHAEVFIFNYGVIIFWNFTESQEKAVIADLTLQRSGEAALAIRPANDQDIELEEFSFRYIEESEAETITKPRIFNDMITLTSTSHMLKLAISHAIAQSTKLSRFEERMQATMKDVKFVPKTLALTGQLGLKREQVMRMSGRLFKLRVDVNLSSDVLDTPEIFWESEPSLNPLYTAVREYLEIDQRILVINERCMVFLQMTEILTDSIAEFNMDRITVIIIILIVLSICVSLLEIAVRFVLASRDKVIVE